MPSDTVLSSAPIQTSVPADNNIYNAEDADSYWLAWVGVIALADDGLRDAIDDMPPLPDSISEPPHRVIAIKWRCKAAKSWVWSYFKELGAAGKHCLCLICNTRGGTESRTCPPP